MLRGQRKPGARWLTTDTAMAMALQHYEQTLCDGCGNPIAESMDPDSEGEWFAPPPARCHACTAVWLRAQEYVSTEARKITAPPALRYHAVRTPRKRRPPSTT